MESIDLLVGLRGPEPEDVDRLAAAAAHAIERRFVIQARKILQCKHLLALVPDLEPDLRAVAQAS
ncbi:MAG TPA: hypothetical protein VGR22_09045 [Thermomicrobiales bacterium]|nr:hypothetical protein [Thermomicrobiales bacterium]